ncbi:MAG: hydroxymethylbilane synthase, partial [Dehalococcoidia bacterium]|nr:hydroxymethylbilane synthase [Dehalococcoidia bacterium]
MKLSRTVRVGSRSSPLALAQTEEIVALLRARFADVRFDVVRLSTSGDRNASAALTSLGRGAFVKDIELAVLEGEIDFAVHSAKDVGPDIPDGLRILPVGERQDARDVLVSKAGLSLMSLPTRTRLGTGSPRRKAQIKSIRPDVEVLPVRGNVGTRLEKARGADYDGVVIAAAGLARLGKLSEATEFLDVEQVTPDVGQGTLVAEFRQVDDEMGTMLASVVVDDTAGAFLAERAFLDTIGGGCTAPVAAYGEIDGRGLRMHVMAAEPDGGR